MSQSSATVLASGAITAADTITIVLVEANEIPLPLSSSAGPPSRPYFTCVAFRLALTLPPASSRVPWVALAQLRRERRLGQVRQCMQRHVTELWVELRTKTH